MMQHNVVDIVQTIPEPLRERTRVLHPCPLLARGTFILYWMHHAMRVNENPALEVAAALANRLELPLFVYQGLSEDYAFASDRHHTFILQGARDVQRALREHKIAYAFHLAREGHKGPHLKTLARRSALVVTEEMPVEPILSFTSGLCRELETPVVAVDTACVVPMQRVGQAFERAFAFRDATRALYAERVGRDPTAPEVDCRSMLPDALPFEPVDFESATIAELVAQCDVDHLVGPVPHTVGGEAAGYSRWNAFRDHALAKYDRLRNDPLSDGVSRLSPYLHYGMVSPMRIASEAAAGQEAGAEKYLDELLIWREMAYAFCFYRKDHANLSAIPKWARETLAAHRADPRPERISWERLARGKTGDALWDAAQQSLLMHGELHNNVRMTWGKALLNWTTNPRNALAMMIDLNHRYALDGRDPASYGGILWCLGQFDRPFPPARPIFGTVRGRSTAQHARRLDPARYRRRTTRPLNDPMPSVAVIGAGMAGLVCARTLMDHGFPVTVFEKSRGVGGRMATRRSDELQFDHGAQYFTVRDRRFGRYVKSWIDDGIVARWQAPVVVLKHGRIEEPTEETERFVALPGMNAICRHLATDLDVRLETRVLPLQRRDRVWRLESEKGEALGAFDLAMVTAPPLQSAELLQELPHLAAQARQVGMRPCWAVMLALEHSLNLPWEGAFVHDSPLSWVACNGRKPGRQPGPETWVLHASSDWSRAHLDATQESAAHDLVTAFWEAIGRKPTPVRMCVAHRWRFALPPKPLPDRCLFNPSQGVGACGDWCAGPRVEGAFLSGAAAAGRIMGLLKPQPVSTVFVERQARLFD